MSAASPAGAAFFDFDKTLISTDVGPAFGMYLFKRKQNWIEEVSRNGVTAWFRNRVTDVRYAGFMTGMLVATGAYRVGLLRRSTLTRLAYRGLRGVPIDVFRGEMDRFVDLRVPDLVFPAVVAEIERHQAAGRPVVIITTGLEELVQRCLRHFPPGIETIGCRMHLKDGRMTGRVDGPLYGADKANIVRAYCLAAGTDLADCHAYTDHYSDYHMLAEVGHGYCVNPRGRLRKLARRRGWTVINTNEPR